MAVKKKEALDDRELESEIPDIYERESRSGKSYYYDYKVKRFTSRNKYFGYIESIQKKVGKRKAISIGEYKELDRFERKSKYIKKVPNFYKPSTQRPLRTYMSFRFVKSGSHNLFKSALSETDSYFEQVIHPKPPLAFDGFYSRYDMARKIMLNSPHIRKFVVENYNNNHAQGEVDYHVYYKIEDPDGRRYKGKTVKRSSIKLDLHRDYKEILFLASLK